MFTDSTTEAPRFSLVPPTISTSASASDLAAVAVPGRSSSKTRQSATATSHLIRRSDNAKSCPQIVRQVTESRDKRPTFLAPGVVVARSPSPSDLSTTSSGGSLTDLGELSHPVALTLVAKIKVSDKPVRCLVECRYVQPTSLTFNFNITLNFIRFLLWFKHS